MSSDASSTNFFTEILKTIQRKDEVKNNFQPAVQKKVLVENITKWKIDSIKKIEATAADALNDVETTVEEASNIFSRKMTEFESEMQTINQRSACDQSNLEKMKKILDDCEEQIKFIATLKSIDNRSLLIHKITIDKGLRGTSLNAPYHVGSVAVEPPTRNPSEFSGVESALSSTTSRLHLLIIGNQLTMRNEVKELFNKLDRFLTANRQELIDRNFEHETNTMMNFLGQNFGFADVPGQHIVEKIPMFRISNPPSKQGSTKVVPFNKGVDQKTFHMTIEELVRWQKSYAVYAVRTIDGMTKAFIRSALQGNVNDVQGAFRMKFLVRISTCPVLMDIDGSVITRQIRDAWPNRIKLVTAIGIDFLGRKHDVNDITTYVTNWRDVFQLDPLTGGFLVEDDLFLIVKPDAPEICLNQKRLHDDLVTMARLRLQACDREKVQIVIETGIGLGVFSGSHLRIDDAVRKASAKAIRQVLETDGSSYKNILAVVFALPIYSPTSSLYNRSKSIHEAFVKEFSRDNYSSPIPVMIFDQDVHRLAVNIAQAGFCVSELNPSDSLGVFGGYWQSSNSSFCGKLAVTTLGLLVQHHLINESVLDINRYNLI